MRTIWDSFKEVRTIVAVFGVILFALTYFIGQYDNISLIEYWTLFLVCAAACLYLVSKHGDGTAKPYLMAVLFGGLVFLGAVIYRQQLRYNNYEVSWDIGYLNTRTDLDNRAIQVFLCVVNPNDFTVFVRVPSILVDIDKASGSFANDDKDEIYEIGPYSTNGILVSDAIPIGDADSGPHKGLFQADIQYGRDKDRLDKSLPVRANPQYLQDDLDRVIGVLMDRKTSNLPQSYDLLPPMRESKCRRIHR